ncbi:MULTISPECIES: LTA synthase family protein [Pseudomonas]|uniref:Sulfatase N-terminal domain-containing protein n=1 Tax=Pseudomonas fluorescens TaxID=294 RepID=A0A5E6UDD1_PSEFL|nr:MULTISPECIES: alkaline phosphatase family protein [Pseudomonas]VVM98935.1 hypothetical protein PS652_03187 [Pseudomonas fluorescens]
MKATAKIIIETLCILVLFGTQILLAIYLQNFTLYADETLRLFPLLVSLTPVALIYLLARFAFPPLLTTALISTTLMVLSLVNNMKLALTNDPLSWSDISSTANASVIWHYLSLQHVGILLAAIVLCILALRINPYNMLSKHGIALNLTACLLIAPIALCSYSDLISQSFAVQTDKLSKKLGVYYISWDWPVNIERNGLPLHLVHTSRRAIPAEATDAQASAFTSLQAPAIADSSRPKNIIFILCEACWHDEQHFKSAFTPLANAGFKEIRSVSPVYGGATVNATFELLTGLPSAGALSGVIYQEYAPLISNSAHTLPRYLRAAGYNTTEEHNHGKQFWKRDIVSPKFGFDKFVGLEDMGQSVTINWADDEILFDHAFNELQKNRSNFMFLTTVSTHGPYPFIDDYGQGYYLSKLSHAIQRVAAFAERVKAYDNNALIMVVGDHKPALNTFFYKEGIFSKDQFETIGETNGEFTFSANSSPEIRGDVPVYIMGKDEARISQFVEKSKGKPFFCLSQLLDNDFINSGVPAYNFAKQNSICANGARMGYKAIVSLYPDWLYSLSILK